MRSDDVGLQGRLKQINENLVYTWCYAHKLNLSISKSVSCVLSAKNLFGLLQSAHTFCSESYKRTIQWEKVTAELKGHKKLIRLENFGKTRWYSNDRSLRKIFKSYSDIDTDVYVALLKFLNNVKTSESFEPKASFEASALLDNFTKMETILTALTFLKIFDILGPTAKYFQTKGLNMMAALKMVQSAAKEIKNFRDSFAELKEKAVDFAIAVNDIISDEMDVCVEETIPASRIRRVKRRDGEKASDEPILNELEKYRVNQFLVIFDTTYQSITERFCGESNELIEEMSMFHPESFAKLAKLKTLKLPFLARVLKIESGVLVKELKHFANQFSSFTNVIDLENVSLIDSEDDCDSDEDEDEDVDSDDNESDDEKETHKCKTPQKPCNKCLACCFILLCKLNLHISTYTNLHRAYEYFMTLPCTEVACERAFSKLKIIKSRLRSSLLQKHLDSLMLMFIERELTYELDVDAIIESFARTTNVMKRLLIE
jgi:hAT family C-terminal dimerisation region